MKKLFVISCDFDLVKKPIWLDAFCTKYGKSWLYHITLKTQTSFDSKNVDELKTNLKKIVNNFHSLKIIFNHIKISRTSKGNCIMIMAEKNEELLQLQEVVSNTFSKYGQHSNEDYEKHEKNFNPHITIARRLDSNQLNDAKKELQTDTHCEAEIKDVTLSLVENDALEEWSKPENRFIFKLRNHN